MCGVYLTTGLPARGGNLGGSISPDPLQLAAHLLQSLLGGPSFGRPLGEPVCGACLCGAELFTGCRSLGGCLGPDPLNLGAHLLQGLLCRRSLGRPLGGPLFGACLGGAELFAGCRGLGGSVSPDPFQLGAHPFQSLLCRGSFVGAFHVLTRGLRLDRAGPLTCLRDRARGLFSLSPSHRRGRISVVLVLFGLAWALSR
jgi:hypothetical protein